MVWLEVKVKAALDIRESVRVVGIDWSHQHRMRRWISGDRKQKEGSRELQGSGLWRGDEEELR